jgi:Mg2+/Co2+ transporter CorB
MTTEWGRLLQENKQEILERWMEQELLLFSGKMAPGSPVAEALSGALEMLLDHCENNSKFLTEALVQVSRILAVQDFPPSRAMSLFFELKKIIQELSLRGGTKKSLKQAELDMLQNRLEEITLQAFDSYMIHREKISQLKVDEAKRMIFMQLRRAEG